MLDKIKQEYVPEETTNILSRKARIDLNDCIELVKTLVYLFNL